MNRLFFLRVWKDIRFPYGFTKTGRRPPRREYPANCLCSCSKSVRTLYNLSVRLERGAIVPSRRMPHGSELKLPGSATREARYLMQNHWACDWLSYYWIVYLVCNVILNLHWIVYIVCNFISNPHSTPVPSNNPSRFWWSMRSCLASIYLRL